MLTVINRGLGALLCEKFAAEGCNIVVNYVSSKDRADEVAKICSDKYGVKTAVIQAVGCPPSLSSQQTHFPRMPE
jgi:NAD(P)-dependent dehydrogenase (short-subunit alcohol dehydrogenase family)